MQGTIYAPQGSTLCMKHILDQQTPRRSTMCYLHNMRHQIGSILFVDYTNAIL